VKAHTVQPTRRAVALADTDPASSTGADYLGCGPNDNTMIVSGSSLSHCHHARHAPGVFFSM